MIGSTIGFWFFLIFMYTAFKFVKCVRLVPTMTAQIVERLGKYNRTLGPGFHVILPFFDRVAFIQDLKEEAIEVPPQECFTEDNVKVEVDGVLYLSVMNPEEASYGITDYKFAAIQLAQTTTRSVIGTIDLDRTFEEREAINSRVVSVLSEVSDAWGVQVHRYEIKNIVTPMTVRDAMERQMGAERDRRALLFSAEGEKTSRINNSEGQMSEAINRSEGEMQRRINEAEGKAQEILAVAKATADSIRMIGEALAIPGGVEATNLRLREQYIKQLENLAKRDTTVLMPTSLNDVQSMIRTFDVTDGVAHPSSGHAIHAKILSAESGKAAQAIAPPLASSGIGMGSRNPALRPQPRRAIPEPGQTGQAGQTGRKALTSDLAQHADATMPAAPVKPKPGT